MRFLLICMWPRDIFHLQYAPPWSKHSVTAGLLGVALEALRLLSGMMSGRPWQKPSGLRAEPQASLEEEVADDLIAEWRG